MWLTDKQVEKLTRRKRVPAQVKVLVDAGIPFDMVDGRPVVMVSSLGGEVESATRPQVRRLA